MREDQEKRAAAYPAKVGAWLSEDASEEPRGGSAPPARAPIAGGSLRRAIAILADADADEHSSAIPRARQQACKAQGTSAQEAATPCSSSACKTPPPPPSHSRRRPEIASTDGSRPSRAAPRATREDRDQDGEYGAVREPAGRRVSRSRCNSSPAPLQRDPSPPAHRQVQRRHSTPQARRPPGAASRGCASTGSRRPPPAHHRRTSLEQVKARV